MLSVHKRHAPAMVERVCKQEESLSCPSSPSILFEIGLLSLQGQVQAGLRASGDSPVSTSHLPAGDLELQSLTLSVCVFNTCSEALNSGPHMCMAFVH